MTNKTNKTLFTKEFIDNLDFLVENQNAVEDYEEDMTYHGLGGCDPDGYYTYSEELKELAEKFEDLFPEVNQQINDYFNINFTQLFDFLEENKRTFGFLEKRTGTNYCDLEAKLIEYLEDYMAD